MKNSGNLTSKTIERLTVNVDKELAKYYRKIANNKGVSISGFIRESMMQGVIADNAYDFEKRMEAVLSNMRNMLGSKDFFVISKSGMKSIYVCENILAKIISAQNIQALYEAQDQAKKRISQETEDGDDQSK